MSLPLPTFQKWLQNRMLRVLEFYIEVIIIGILIGILTLCCLLEFLLEFTFYNNVLLLSLFFVLLLNRRCCCSCCSRLLYSLHLRAPVTFLVDRTFVSILDHPNINQTSSIRHWFCSMFGWPLTNINPRVDRPNINHNSDIFDGHSTVDYCRSRPWPTLPYS